MASPSPRHREHYYEPSPRFNHYTARAGGNIYTWGGRTQEFSDIGKVKLQSAIEIFDPYLEVWDQQATKGDPPPGLYGGECAAIEESMYVCFGNDGKKLHSTIHKFDTTKLEWKQVQIQNPSEGPSAKSGFGMVAYQGDKLAIFAGHGISTGSTQHGASFVKSSDSTGWSNEFHLINLKEGSWSSPPTTGEKPPPCSAFSFTVIDDHRAVFFGGFQAGHRKLNDVYILDLQTMHWRKLSIAGRGPLPDARSAHSACCINFGEEHPQVLVTGGRNNDNDTLKDAWLLDINSESWKELPLPDDLPARWGHTTTAFSLAPGLAEVAMFGGSPKFIRGARSDDEFPQVAETIVLQLESVEVAPSSREWVLVGVTDKSQLGTPERVQQKMDRVQQRAITVEEKDITPEERAMRAAREEIEEANRRAQEARKMVENLQKALEESQAKVRQLSEEKERATERIEETRGRKREVERQLQTKEDEARMQQQQVDSFRRQLASKEDQLNREKQQADKVPSLEHLLHSREGTIKGMQEQVSSLKQQLDSKEKEMGNKELEVILLQQNLKGREDEVKQKEEEMRTQNEEKHQLTTQMQSLQYQMNENEKHFEEERGELLKDVQAGIVLMQQMEEKLGRKRMPPPFPVSSHLPTVWYPIAAPIQEAEVQQRVTDPTEHEEMAEFRHESPRQVTEDATAVLIQEAEVQRRVTDTTEQMVEFRHESPRQVKAEATEQGSEPIQLRKETTNQQQEIIQEHIEQQHMTDVDKAEVKDQQIPTEITETQQKHLQAGSIIRTPPPQTHLRGTEIVAQKTFILTQESQSFRFTGYGFKIHVPEGSLPAEISETALKVQVSLSGQFQMPHDCELLSAVYWVYSPHKFTKPLTVEIQHSAVLSSNQQCSQLTFVSTNCTQKELPYMFKLRDGSVFSHHSSYGSLSLSHFSGLGIAKRTCSLTSVQTTHNQPKQQDEEIFNAYCGRVFTCKGANDCIVYFVITKNLDAHRTVVEELYSTKSRENIDVSLGFDDDEKIQLSIPKCGKILESGWKIRPLHDPIIMKNDVDRFSGKSGIPKCELLLLWTHADTPHVHLEHEINLTGAKNCTFFILYIPDAVLIQLQEAKVQQRVTATTEQMVEFRHESPRQVKAEATEHRSEPIQLRKETTNQQQEIIREQKEYIDKQKEHMSELWRQVDHLEEILTAREEELHHLKSQANMANRREPTSSSSLNIKDLADITEYLHPLLPPAVFNLGLVLGLQYKRLVVLMDSQHFLEDVLAGWLERMDQVEEAGVPTWKKLVEALRDPRIGHNGIASKIEKCVAKQGTQKLQ